MKKKGSADPVVVGSKEYWHDKSHYRETWESRAVEAAAFIRPGSRVLDLGCGPHMALEKRLPDGCTYIPADLKRWNPLVTEIDLDAELLPQDLKCDCVVLLGVIEYLRHPRRTFSFARKIAPRCVISYCHPVEGASLRQWKTLGWINAFPEDKLEPLLSSVGWRIAGTKTYSTSAEIRQVIYSLTSDD